MTFDTVRRIAADILSVGKKRIRFATDKLSEIKNAMTREDVRNLINKKAITILPKKGRRKKKKRKKRGEGSIKGSKSGKERKKEWMARVRSQRKLLSYLVENNILKKEHKRNIYLKIKGNSFRSKRALLTYLKDNNLIPKDFELKKGDKK
ncbi:MAG: 50S ribosomal protein L19e [Candidatus Bilamarchaeaceae archaeon]